MRYIPYLFLFLSVACSQQKAAEEQEEIVEAVDSIAVLKPVFVTEKSDFDTDDPAFWINPADPAQSLILGTDKGDENNENAALMVYDLEGKIIADKCIKGLTRVNNVDICYGFSLGGETKDLAVLTERGRDMLRVFTLPDMQAVDAGGIPVFADDSLKAPMGVALYQQEGATYAIVSRKFGLSGSYLWQYELKEKEGKVVGEVVRKFGKFEGGKEIEAIAVDQELGYVYYSDEGKGVRKYYADPAKGDEELALFATEGFTDDHEGISIYTLEDGTGYILVSDQQANQFHIFPREGTADNPHAHTLLKTIKVSTNESDGSEVTSLTLNPTFEGGLFVAMSDDKTFHFYRWKDIAGDDLKVRVEK
ncbi:phytase [Flammeovirgaceae bacterium SG7u.111]|nr:phytase [Flammeovirgaceae bacterium SG7u.132]WPO37435.1 phytase [Flammeovirgaceae bacterium SG7u.111]